MTSSLGLAVRTRLSAAARTGSAIGRGAVVLLALAVGTGAAQADKIKNPTAVFSGLDKITGRIVSFEVAVNETVQFGALQMTPRICFTRPATESPQTTSFVEIDEVTLENSYRRIFSGWMFAASPGLSGVEHPVYDLWLVDCKGGTEVIAEPKDEIDEPAPSQPQRRQADRPAERPSERSSERPSNRAAERPAERQAAPAAPRSPEGRVDVAPPRGVPTQPVQQPTRRFFPTTPLTIWPSTPGGGNN